VCRQPAVSRTDGERGRDLEDDLLRAQAPVGLNIHIELVRLGVVVVRLVLSRLWAFLRDVVAERPLLLYVLLEPVRGVPELVVQVVLEPDRGAR
jgi:hypothetical protein